MNSKNKLAEMPIRPLRYTMAVPLMLGWAEQLEQDASLPDAARQKAGGIRTQSEKLRTLIDDLNLTSKLQYGAQPLRRERFAAGPLLRQLAAQFSEGPLAQRCELSLTVTDDGTGYPPAVLAALYSPEPGDNTPHILGLHVVEQIAAAHGGQAVFSQNTPHGAKTMVWLPLDA